MSRRNVQRFNPLFRVQCSMVANGWQITIFQVLKMLKIKDSCGLMP
nr:MAG TPA: hypothetical protein [Caudoviricetes sp.]